MRRIRCSETNIIPYLLCVAVVLTALFYSGCAPIHKLREDPNLIYRGYDGPTLPRENVAVVWWDYTVVTIDGTAVNERGPSPSDYFAAELLPGRHVMEVEVHAKSAPAAYVKVDADLAGGHLYKIKAKTRLYPREPVDYAVWLIDEETGSFVAGRPPEVLNWSLKDWEEALQKLKRGSATERQAIQLLSEPIDRLSDETAVYLACRRKGLTRDWPIYVKPPANCGLLFVEFDESGSLRGHTFVDVPFRECFRSPFTAWDTESWHSEYWACKSRLIETAHDEFRAVTGKPAE